MKILSVAEFDPAHVLHGHRQTLRALDVDYRLAVCDVYPRYVETPDYKLGSCDMDDLARFAEEADVLQFHPAIGQPWSFSTLHPRYDGDGEKELFGPINWTRFKRPKRISYFHGSRNAAANADRYAKHWREQGHAIWASTLDYVDWMDATYAPPIIESENLGRSAKLRGDDDPLIIVHAPTDQANSHTEEFLALCRGLGIVVNFVFGQPHAATMEIKRRCHAGFDHLRGAFSVNTIENAMLGLVPLVGVKRQYLSRLEEELDRRTGDLAIFSAWDMFIVENLTSLEHFLIRLRDDVELTRIHQRGALAWSGLWTPEVLGPKLLKKYEALL